MSFDYDGEEESNYLPPRRFGMPLGYRSRRNSSTNSSTSNRSSLNGSKISLEEYEREGLIETRKELTLLFERLQSKTELTKHLPHVARAVQENGKSSAQTSRLRALSISGLINKWLLFLSFVLILIVALVGVHFYYNFHIARIRLPFVASMSSDSLLQALKECTFNMSTITTAVSLNTASTHGTNVFASECVNFVDPATLSTPLHIASMTGNINNVLLLIQNGASLTASDRMGRTPLHVAGNVEVVSFLLQNGANAAVTDMERKTPLFTCLNGDQVHVLLSHYTDSIRLQDISGSTALICTLQEASGKSSESDFNTLLQKARAILKYPSTTVPNYPVSLKNRQGETALSVLNQLASKSTPHRSPVYAHLMVDVLKMTLESPYGKQEISAIKSLEILSTLASSNAVSALSVILNSLQLHSGIQKIISVHETDSKGLLPISHCKSSACLVLFWSAGGKLDEQPSPLTTSSSTPSILSTMPPSLYRTPLQHILSTFLTNPMALQSQVEMVKSIINEFGSEYIDKEMSYVPKNIEFEIKDKMNSISVVQKEWTWNAQTLLVGMELLASPGTELFQTIRISPSKSFLSSFILPPQTTATFTIYIDDALQSLKDEAGLGKIFPSIDLLSKSKIDNVHMKTRYGQSSITYSSSNSWFGAYPRIYLPLSEFVQQHNVSALKTDVSCSNLLSNCEITFIATFGITDLDDKHSTSLIDRPIVNGFYSFDFHLYSLARLASILWLPISMLPNSIPLPIRYSVFVLSLLGLFHGGLSFALHWILYTTLSHLLLRILGW